MTRNWFGPGAGLRRRIAAGTASNAAGRVVSLLIVFLLTPFILSHVGVTGYGLWILIGSVVAYGELLDLGIGSAVIKYIAQFRATGNVDQARTLIATALRLYLVLGATALGLSVVLATAFTHVFDVTADEQLVTLIVLLTGVNLAITIASAPAMSILAGLQRFDLHNVIAIGGSLMWACGVVIALSLDYGLVGLVAVSIPTTLIARLVSIQLTRRVAPDLPIGYSGASLAVARQVIGFSSAVFATHISGLLQKKTDEIVIAASLLVAAVTPYALARKISEIAFVLTSQFVRVLLPVASELHASSDVQRLRRLYLVSTRLTAAAFVPIGLGAVVLGGDILNVWVGPGFDEAVPVIALLTLASFLLTSAWPAGSILQGMARFRWVAVSSMASGLVNLILSIWLVTQMGIIGVAIGTLIPTAVETMCFVLPYTMRVLGVGISQVLRAIWLPVLVPAVPCALTLYLLRELLHPDSLLALTLVAGSGALVYALAYLAMPAAGEERQALSRAIGQLWNALSRTARGEVG